MGFPVQTDVPNTEWVSSGTDECGSGIPMVSQMKWQRVHLFPPNHVALGNTSFKCCLELLWIWGSGIASPSTSQQIASNSFFTFCDMLWEAQLTYTWDL